VSRQVTTIAHNKKILVPLFSLVSFPFLTVSVVAGMAIFQMLLLSPPKTEKSENKIGKTEKRQHERN
jgi:hypothetical protein